MGMEGRVADAVFVVRRADSLSFLLWTNRLDFHEGMDPSLPILWVEFDLFHESPRSPCRCSSSLFPCGYGSDIDAHEPSKNALAHPEQSSDAPNVLQALSS